MTHISDFPIVFEAVGAQYVSMISFTNASRNQVKLFRVCDFGINPTFFKHWLLSEEYTKQDE